MKDSTQRIREFWDARPCNIRHSNKPVGTKEYFNEVEARRYFVEPHNYLFAEFKRWKNKKVLEVGCGIGTDTINFARAGAHVSAAEISEKSLNITRQRAKVFKQKIVFEYTPNGSLKFLPRNSFDLVYAFGVIHHDPYPVVLMHDIRDRLKKGGTLKIMLYHKYSFKNLWIILKFGHGRFWKAKELIAKYSEAQTGCPITRVYSKKEAIALFERTGFEVVKCEIDFIFPYVINDYIKYRYKKVWYFRWMPEFIFGWIQKHWGWNIMIEAIAI